ncbi:MAG: hypothetical protein AB1742_06180 [bacterium]
MKPEEKNKNNRGHAQDVSETEGMFRTEKTGTVMIVKTLKDISRILTKSRVPYMVIGGQAAAVFRGTVMKEAGK